MLREIVQYAVNSLPLGAEYALLATGLTTIFGILGIPNIAHGATFMFGGYAGYVSVTELGMPLWAGLLMAAGVGALLGELMYVAVFDRIGREDTLTQLVASLALLTIFSEVAILVFGSEARRVSVGGSETFTTAGIIFPRWVVFYVPAAIVVSYGTYLIAHKTAFGRAMRAVAENREAAALQGIGSKAVAYGTFAFGSAVGGLAGALVGTFAPVQPEMGIEPILKAFVIVIVAGLGSILGSLAVGFSLAALETFATAYIGGAYSEVAAFLILVLVLLVRPQGVFPARRLGLQRAVDG